MCSSAGYRSSTIGARTWLPIQTQFGSGSSISATKPTGFGSAPDEELLQLGRQELDRIGIIDSADVLDGTVIRMEKTYPAYFGTYDRFSEIRSYVDTLENLFLLGRNGMHRYNNQDHSMLTAMVAVDNILAGETGKANLWEINTEEESHEEKNG